nr:glycosyltransferase family 4 protein [uncultured Cohaesibacter sp.]
MLKFHDTNLEFDFDRHVKNLKKRVQDRAISDAALYSVVFPNKTVHIFYFLEDNQLCGMPEIHSFESVTSDIFEGNYFHHITVSPNKQGGKKDEENSFEDGDIYVALPFAENPNFNACVKGPKRRLHNYVYHRFPEFYDSRRQKFFDEQAITLKKRETHGKIEKQVSIFNPMAYMGGQIKNAKSIAQQLNPEGRPVAVIGMHWLDTGGAESCALEALEAAHEAGFLTICITDRRGKEILYNRADKASDYIFQLDSTLPDNLWRQFYSNLLYLLDVKILHIHHCASMFENLPLIKAISPKTKVISSTHIIEFQDSGYCRISGVYANYIDIQHVISKELSAYYAEEFQVTKDKIDLSYLVHGESRIEEPHPKPHKALREKCRLLFVGRMAQQKRPYLIANIAQKLMKEKLDFSITMVGGGDMLELTQKHAENLGVDHLIDFRGNLDHQAVKEQMNNHHILLLPSQNEGLALVCYEATMAGVVAISCDVGSQNELISEELLVSRHTYSCIKETANAVKRLASDESFYTAAFSEQVKKFNIIAGSKNYDQFLREQYK